MPSHTPDFTCHYSLPTHQSLQDGLQVSVARSDVISSAAGFMRQIEAAAGAEAVSEPGLIMVCTCQPIVGYVKAMKRMEAVCEALMQVLQLELCGEMKCDQHHGAGLWACVDAGWVPPLAGSSERNLLHGQAFRC